MKINQKIKQLFKFKTILFVLGFVLIVYSIVEHFAHHEDLHSEDVFLLSGFVLFIYLILSFFHKHYNKKDGVKGIVLAEFIHSLVDGVVIGMSFIIGPTAGFAAVLAVISHEIPKITGTFLLIRSLTGKTSETLKYILISLSGIPLMSLSIIFLSEKIGNISPEMSHLIELMSVATLIVVLSRIAYHSYRHRGHDHPECPCCK